MAGVLAADRLELEAELVAVLAILNVCRENLEPEELALREKDLGLITQFRY
jgi:hypothetical protein